MLFQSIARYVQCGINAVNVKIIVDGAMVWPTDTGGGGWDATDPAVGI